MHILNTNVIAPKLNVWCAFSCRELTGPLFFHEKTVNNTHCLVLLELFAVSQMTNLQANILFQQDGVPPHWSLTVRQALKKTSPNAWIGRDGRTPGPSLFPDITPWDFSFWSYIPSKIGSWLNLVHETTVQLLL